MDMFPADGNWYRGNLHMHTTESDGALGLVDALRFYQDRGYHFVTVTDHRKTVPTQQYRTAGFLTIPGIELDCWDDKGREYHVVGVGVEPFEQDGGVRSGQELVDAVRAHGGVAFVAHPYWLGLERADIQELVGAIGIEVYNSVCADSGKGLSDVHWDDLLHHGARLFGVATDDTHRYTYDGAAAWVMVNAAELTEAAIIHSLQAGKFYSTQGPEIHAIRVADGWIDVATSDVEAITFVSNRGRGWTVRADAGESLNTARIKAWTNGYARVECVDSQGRKAWGQPLYF